MKKLNLLFLLVTTFFYSQQFKIDTLLTDKISIRAIQIWDGKVFYAGTDSKFGFVNMKDKSDQKQILLSDKNLQFRTLAQDETDFYTINIESPAYFFKIDKRTLDFKVVYTDTIKTAFYDALHFGKDGFGIALSDPNKSVATIAFKKINKKDWQKCTENCFPAFNLEEAAFAASNTNISSSDKYLWFATGGKSSRIFRQDIVSCKWKVFETPFTQGSSSQGIYSIDFYSNTSGIAVGGDYTKQADNTNNIATTNDGGQTWQIQASGKNAGYMTCVKFRPKTKGKEIIAVGDQHISFSSDHGKTWTKISDEKNLYACEWADKNTLILAGKDKIIKITFQ